MFRRVDFPVDGALGLAIVVSSVPSCTPARALPRSEFLHRGADLSSSSVVVRCCCRQIGPVFPSLESSQMFQLMVGVAISCVDVEFVLCQGGLVPLEVIAVISDGWRN